MANHAIDSTPKKIFSPKAPRAGRPWPPVRAAVRTGRAAGGKRPQESGSGNGPKIPRETIIIGC